MKKSDAVPEEKARGEWRKDKSSLLVMELWGLIHGIPHGRGLTPVQVNAFKEAANEIVLSYSLVVEDS